jgi:hypothetical protein
MTINDEQRFMVVMRYLAINFPERVVDADLVESYFQDLSAFSIESVEEAARAYVRVGTRFPFVSDLHQLALS